MSKLRSEAAYKKELKRNKPKPKLERKISSVYDLWREINDDDINNIHYHNSKC